MSNNVSAKSLGFFSILSLCVGTMVGVGILIAPNMLYKFGKYGHFAWPVASLMCLGLALMFSRLSQMTHSSGPAGFVHDAFGHLPSFQVGWSHWLGFTIAQGIISYAFGQYVSPYVNPFFGYDVSFMLSIGALWITTMISCFLTIFSVSVVMMITALKVLVLTAVIVFGLPYLNLQTITSLPNLTGDATSSFISAMSGCLLAFIGLEVATIPSGNVINPKVTIPAATIVATIIAGVLYTLSYAVVGSAMPQAELAVSNAPMIDAAIKFMGPIGGVMLTALGGLGFFASINGMLYGQVYILKYLSQIRTLPAMFMKETKAGFPYMGALLSAICSTGILILIFSDKIYLDKCGALSTCFVSIAYLWSVGAYRFLGGSTLLWLINLFTSIAFMAGSVIDAVDLIPIVALGYCASFFLYGLFVKTDRLSQ